MDRKGGALFGGMFPWKFTLQGMDTYPTEREKEDHLQNAIFGGYVSFHGSFNLFVVLCLLDCFVCFRWMAIVPYLEDGLPGRTYVAILSPLRIGLWDPFQMAELHGL